MNLQNGYLRMSADLFRPAGVRGVPGGLPDPDIAYAARTDACILLTGAKTAARALARRIHNMSGWRHGPFVVVDCGWPEGLLDARLFDPLTSNGISMSDTGPQPRRAQAGTIFLQDVDRLETALQARLADQLTELRVVGQRGRSRWRFIASTSEFLLQQVRDGSFDDRLYYRLNVIHIVLPATGPGR